MTIPPLTPEVLAQAQKALEDLQNAESCSTCRNWHRRHEPEDTRFGLCYAYLGAIITYKDFRCPLFDALGPVKKPESGDLK